MFSTRASTNRASPLIVNGQQVAAHHDGKLQPAVHAPRPYLHPITSLAGATITEDQPADHRHHLGLSVAIADLNGINFWGGSTYTSNGPAMLPNHGTQVPSGWRHSGGDAAGEVSWRSAGGAELALEKRTIRASGHPEAGTWSLTLNSVMVPGAAVEALEVSSSAVKGRKGAGYGGIFWRFPGGSGEPLIISADGAGETTAHGSLSPWLSVTVFLADGPVGIVLAQDTEPALQPTAEPTRQARFPWFIRAGQYLGAGPAVAWSRTARADHSHPLNLSLHAVIHDGPVETSARALDLLQHHPAFTSPGSPDRTS